jgi:hypothetical protein
MLTESKDALQITYHQDNKTEIVYSCKPTEQYSYKELKPYIEDLSQREKDPNMLESCLAFRG